ncbi:MULTISPECIES: hypothetical protein [Clostridium]|uniref:Uncharacterized protein n=1 Tax=Clostridium senegalense TaxID=1465809 RepID=A0A6M0HA25_9CLOT|nr:MULTISPECIES: hypothetical protein [Clostridium]NEU06532.1 hypothetical protein [Clostridium senegalense]
MKHINQRNMRIINEIMLYCLNIGCKNVNVNFSKLSDRVVINLASEIEDLSKESIDKMYFLLSTPRKPEIEEYYWLLNGGDDTNSELSLVGMMTDEISINYTNNILTINLIRLN